MSDFLLHDSPLGQKSAYICEYTPDLLFPLPRQTKRDEIGIQGEPIFYGYDIWTAYELSWLNAKGKPCVALADIILPASSTFFIESKSFKLYLNSFNQTKLQNIECLQDLLIKDLTHAVGEPVYVSVYGEKEAVHSGIETLPGLCIDDLDIECHEYRVNPDILKIKSNTSTEETLVSHLLKSNCLVTGQPDWGSVQISYQGPEIDKEALLQYIVSFRNHNEFHEQCVERIFMDVYRLLQPQHLTVYARYTRRGGLDINPIRSTHPLVHPKNIRLFRQ